MSNGRLDVSEAMQLIDLVSDGLFIEESRRRAVGRWLMAFASDLHLLGDLQDNVDFLDPDWPGPWWREHAEILTDRLVAELVKIHSNEEPA